MTDLKTILKLPNGLASFSNKELYYIISNLFGLGAFGEHFIEKERLYLNFDDENHVRFLFICTTPILSEKQIEPSSLIYYGHFDEEFEEIEIYGGSVPFKVVRADRSYQVDGSGLSELFANAQRMAIKPIHLVNGLIRLIETADIKTRKSNDSFVLSREDIPGKYQRTFNLYGQYLEHEERHRNFSGCYYLVAEPASSFDDEEQESATIVYEYNLSKSENYSIEKQLMNIREMSRWENLEFNNQ